MAKKCIHEIPSLDIFFCILDILSKICRFPDILFNVHYNAYFRERNARALFQSVVELRTLNREKMKPFGYDLSVIGIIYCCKRDILKNIFLF